MSLTVLVVDSWRGEPCERAKLPRSKLTRAQRRATPRPAVLDGLSQPQEEALDRVLAREDLLTGHPLVSSWHPTGRQLCYRGRSLEDLLDELRRLLVLDAWEPAEREVIAALRHLTETAMSRGAVMVLSPD